MKTDDRDNYGTPFSYATDSHDNAFTVTDYSGWVQREKARGVGEKRGGGLMVLAKGNGRENRKKKLLVYLCNYYREIHVSTDAQDNYVRVCVCKCYIYFLLYITTVLCCM